MARKAGERAPRKTAQRTESAAKKPSARSKRAAADDAPPQRGPEAVGAVLTFDQIIGQDAAIRTLRAGVGSGRLHHAWVFQGPAGVGKFTTAVSFATALLEPGVDERADPLAFDPEGPTRRRVEAGTHPDLHVVRKELASFSRNERVRPAKQSNIPIDVLREFLIEPASLIGGGRDGRGARQVFIVDEAELMDDGPGQNALLKTLEEPGPGTVIILVTSAPERLLPTIRSRSQAVNFRPLDDAAMKTWLKRSGLAAGAAPAWLLDFAEGAPGMARLALESPIATWPERVEPMLDALRAGRAVYGAGQAIAELVDAWATWWVEAHEQASKDAANRAATRHMLRLIASRCRRSLRDAAQCGGSLDGTLAEIELLQRAESRADGNVNLQFVWEELAAGLMPAGVRPAR